METQVALVQLLKTGTRDLKNDLAERSLSLVILAIAIGTQCENTIRDIYLLKVSDFVLRRSKNIFIFNGLSVHAAQMGNGVRAVIECLSGLFFGLQSRNPLPP